MKYLNCFKQIFFGVGDYDIPEILPESEVSVKEWIGFNYARNAKYKDCVPANTGVHFFLDDYQFERVWTEPTRYLDRVRKFDVVLSPDFSMYTDFPKAVQIYQHYRKHWLGRYWQENGAKVIPTISWSDEESFEWCFDGEPHNSIVAISNVGCMNNDKARKNFMRGYNKMLEVLEPSKVLLFAQKLDDYKGNIEVIKVDRFKELHEKQKKGKEC